MIIRNRCAKEFNIRTGNGSDLMFSIRQVATASCSHKSEILKASQTKILADFPIGSRLLVRSKKDWRSAVISKVIEETVTLIVSSPTGFSYRLRRNLQTEIFFDGELPILENSDEDWRENFVKYDVRW